MGLPDSGIAGVSRLLFVGVFGARRQEKKQIKIFICGPIC